MATNRAQIILALIDQVTPTATRVTGAFQRIGTAFRTLSRGNLSGPVQQLRSLTGSANTAANRVRAAATRMRASFTSLTAQIRQSTQRLREFRQETGGLNAGAGIGGGLAAVTAGLGLQQGITGAAEFEQQLARIQALAGLTAEETKRFGQEVRALARETGTDPTESLRAGYTAFSQITTDTTEVLGLLADAQRLAFVDVNATSSEAIGALATVLNSFGIEVAQSGVVVDQLFAAVQTGGAGLGQLVDPLARLGGQAASLGISFQEVVGGLAAITANGVPASEAATQMKALFALFARDADGLTQKLQEVGAISGTLGDALRDPEVGLRGITAALNEIGNTEGPSELADLTGGIEALQGVLSLGGTAAETFADALDNISASAGLTREASAAIAENFGVSFNSAITNLTASFQGLIAVGVGDFLLSVVEAVDSTLFALTQLAESSAIVRGALQLVGVALVALPILAFVGFLQAGVARLGLFSAALGTTSIAMRVLTLSIAATRTAVLGLFALLISGSARAAAFSTAMAGIGIAVKAVTGAFAAARIATLAFLVSLTPFVVALGAVTTIVAGLAAVVSIFSDIEVEPDSSALEDATEKANNLKESIDEVNETPVNIQATADTGGPDAPENIFHDSLQNIPPELRTVDVETRVDPDAARTSIDQTLEGVDANKQIFTEVDTGQAQQEVDEALRQVIAEKFLLFIPDLSRIDAAVQQIRDRIEALTFNVGVTGQPGAAGGGAFGANQTFSGAVVGQPQTAPGSAFPASAGNPAGVNGAGAENLQNLGSFTINVNNDSATGLFTRDQAEDLVDMLKSIDSGSRNDFSRSV